MYQTDVPDVVIDQLNYASKYQKVSSININFNINN